MMRSMYASVSGLKVHQIMMDVIGNNISNVNTTGYKSSRTTFKELLNQTLKGASAPDGSRGGTNPQQIGLGVALGSIDTDMSTGNLQPTSRQADLAIEGDGFFIVYDGEQNCYTRIGSFFFDANGDFCSTVNGYKVQGVMADESGRFPDVNASNLRDINLSDLLNSGTGTRATANISYGGNLNAAAENIIQFNPSKTAIEDVDTNTDNISISFSKVSGYNRWEFVLECDDESSDFVVNGTPSGDSIMTGYITLNADGTVASIEDDSGSDLTSLGVDLGGTTPVDIGLINTGEDFSEELFLTGGTSGTVEDVAGSYELNARRTMTANTYDSQGTRHSVEFTVVKEDNNQWVIQGDSVKVSGADLSGVSDHTISFDEFGRLTGGYNLDLTFTPHDGAAEQTIALDFSGLTQYEGDMTANFDTVDGYPNGEFQSYVIDSNGIITGSFSNGRTKPLAQIALASFRNPEGLSRDGELFMVSNNSGDAQFDAPGVGNRGSLAPGNLEMSNVDLAQQFTDMITSQRGFQANSRIITTSDEMLQELVNLKR